MAEGSRVQAGQVLGRIDTGRHRQPRGRAQRQCCESARATLAQAERTHASNERLAAQQFISPIALDNSRAALDTARASLDAAQAALDTTRVGLRDATLLAPIAGIVAKRHVLPGEKVSAEQQVLTIVDLARLELAGSVGTHEVVAPGAGHGGAGAGRRRGRSRWPGASRASRRRPSRARARSASRSSWPTRRRRCAPASTRWPRVTLADDTDRLTLPASRGGQHRRARTMSG